MRIADAPLSRRVGYSLAERTGELGPYGVRGAPVAVEAESERELELLWDEPNPVAPTRWAPTEGGWSWRLAPDTDVHASNTARSLPIPGLVAVGTRAGRTVLVNLEALGSVSVVGDPAATQGFIRSLIVELVGTTEHAETRGLVVGAGLVDDQLLGRFRRTTASDAFSIMAAICHRRASSSRDASAGRSVGHRRSGATGHRDLTIVIAAADAFRGTTSMNWVAPNLGVAVVLLGAAPTRSTLTIAADGSASLEPLGLKFDAIALRGAPEATPSRCENLSPESTVSRHRDDADDRDRYELPAPDLLVRVLGAPRIEGYPQLGRIDVSLVAFLACNGGKATEGQLINAVWGGRAIERATMWNRISKVRVSLGSAIPPRDQGSSIIRLAGGVVTDHALLEVLLSRAVRAPIDVAFDLLVRAIQLIDGPPFDAGGYDWSYEHQFHADACSAIERVCVRLAELAIETNDIGTARWAIARGLKALPLNEPLYRWRMTAEAQAGNRAGVRAAFDELCERTSLVDEASVPSAETTERFEWLCSDLSERRAKRHGQFQ